MPKKKHKRHAFPPKRFYLYVKDEGTQYLSEDINVFDEIPEDKLPEDVSEFWFDIHVLTGAHGINSLRHATNLMMKSQMRSGNQEAAANATQEIMFHEMILAIAGWSFVDENDQAIPVSMDALNAISPKWIYHAIEEGHRRVNSLMDSFRR